MVFKKGHKKKANPLIFDGKEYSITKIPLNYLIRVKIMVDGRKPGKRQKLLSWPMYADVARGLEDAHVLAKHLIKKYQTYLNK